MSGVKDKISVLFVCMGNICRSPTAQGVFESRLSQRNLSVTVLVDSAGTHAYHVGEPPDSRSQAAALKRGVDLSSQRARAVSADDFQAFDLIIAMDQANLQALRERCPDALTDRLHLMLDFHPNAKGADVPDPYYGGNAGFERVLDLTERAADGLLEWLCARA
ncbi:MAG: low molecular weight protein-tyrosine-phosphatase [Gammaproteobacteria bacterium]